MNGFLEDGWTFLQSNLKHYSGALWGIGLKLLPDYPMITRFFPTLIRDSVFEWRVYGLLPLWGILISFILPWWIMAPLLLCWSCQSIWRARFFTSSLSFWRQAARETPSPRNLTRYCEELIVEIQEAYKRDDDPEAIEAMEMEAMDLMRRIRKKDNAASIR